MKSFFEALTNLFRKPFTVKYPFEKTYIPDDYRGMIVHNPELCIWCRKCEMVCPPGAIIFSQAMDGKQTYHYNRAVCIYCGECVRQCPKAGALTQSGVPGNPAVKAENINKGWKVTCDEALKSRADYMAAKKAAAAASKPAEGAAE